MRLPSRVKGYVVSIGVFIAFFAVWVCAVSVPLALWNKPSFIADSPVWLRLYWEVAGLLMTTLVTIIFVRIIAKNKTNITFSKRWLHDTLLGFGIGVAWVGSVLLPLAAMGVFAVSNVGYVSLFWVYAVALLLNTMTQELLVRGYLFSLLRARHNAVAAVVATTALFTLLHGGAFEAGVIAVLNVVAASVFLSLLLIYTNSLWVVILVHFMWNLVAGLIFGSITLGDDVHVVQSLLKGDSLLAGGSAGIEGSIVTLFVSVFLIGFLLYRMRRRVG